MPTLCNDIKDIEFTAKKKRINKKEGEKGLSAFHRWLKEQSDGWCSVGLCSSGKCESHWQDVSVKLLDETDEYVDVKFKVTISCRCDGDGVDDSGDDETDNPSGDGSGGNDSGEPKKPCVCTQAEEDAEFQQMIGFYTAAVTNARSLGYQAANDPGYSDPGLGFHKVGNCVDWQQVSWGSLVTRTWKCWKITQIRARQEWTLLTFHHFVKLEAVCSGNVVFLDPWQTGKAEQWPAARFPFPDGKGWAHTETLNHNAGAAPRDPGND